MSDMEQKRNDRAGAEIQRQDSDFITERIKQRPINKKKLLRRTLLTAAMAVVFASVACLTFLVMEPVISNWLYPQEEPAPIEFPAETEEMMPEDMIVNDAQMEEPKEEPPQIKLEDEQIAQVLDNVEMGMDDYADMYQDLSEYAKDVSRAVVTVTGSVSNVDWFNDPYESKDQTSGIIVAKLEQELLILINYENVIDAESIMVTFVGGEQEAAQLKKKDVNTKFAVCSVLLSELEPETIENIDVADLTAGSNNRAIVGNPVIAIGSPMGMIDSVGYGLITSNSGAWNAVDSNYKILTTDIYGSANASGVLINLRGQVLGIIDNSHNSEDMKNLISAVGISELRKVIERMSNDRDQAYLGTYGTDVTQEVHENLGVPIGAYITEIEIDSPAMSAGIQSGDIITGIGGKEIISYSDLVNTLLTLQPEEIVGITLMRQGPEEYLQMDVEVTLGILE